MRGLRACATIVPTSPHCAVGPDASAPGDVRVRGFRGGSREGLRRVPCGALFLRIMAHGFTASFAIFGSGYSGNDARLCMRLIWDRAWYYL